MKPSTKRPAAWATQKMVGERIKIVDKASRKASRKICRTNNYNRSQRIQRKSPCSITIVLSALNDFRIVVMITCRFFKNLERKTFRPLNQKDLLKDHRRTVCRDSVSFGYIIDLFSKVLEIAQ